MSRVVPIAKRHADRHAGTLLVGLLVGLFCGLLSGAVWAWNPLVIDGRCRQSGTGCSSTIGNAGQKQGACCDPSDPGVALCNSNNACIGGRPYLWKRAEVPILWWFNPNGMSKKAGFANYDEGAILAAFQKAWDVWKAPACTSFQHKYQGTTTAALSTSDRKLVLYLPDPKEWVQLGQGSSTLAFTRPIANDQGELRDADIAFNPLGEGGRGWLISPKSGLDLLRVAAHEIGHAFGLAHTHLSKALMFYANQPIPFDGLTVDDTDAICSSYPKRTCQTDNECGGCWRCEGSECVRRKIPEVRNLCKPCAGPDDCGGSRDICIRFPAGNRCAQECDKSGCCPDGYRCADIGLGQMMCLPDAGVCPDITCTQESQCGPGEHCEAGKCAPKPVDQHPKACIPCATDKDCLNGHSCITFPDGSSRCTQPCAAENFCPKGFRCSLQKNGRTCIPDDWICPCQQGAQCGSSEECRDGYCRPKSCLFGCLCSDKAFCPPGFQCAQGAESQLCVRVCGEGASFAPGRQGAPCRQDKSCDDGASCQVVEGLGQVCLKPCPDGDACRGTGGHCYVFRGKSYCMCRSDRECLSGQLCNKAVLGRANAGACATKRTQELACSPDFSCLGAGASQLCLPRSNQPWQSCNDVRSCGTGLTCVLTTTDNQSGICLEDCTTSGKCTRGGGCILRGGTETRLCGCSAQNPCPAQHRCQLVTGASGICVLEAIGVCGNARCEPEKGETCTSCPKDCQCPAGQTCAGDVCALLPTPDGGTSDANICASGQLFVGDAGTLQCQPRQCGCQAANASTGLGVGLLLLLLLGGLRRRQRDRGVSQA